MSVYIHLFHGRDDPEQRMDDWGYQGPTLGPFPYIHTTYCVDIKCGENLVLYINNEMIVHEGKYYGDWSVTSEAIP